ncbi:hypothetical protein [Chryseobacterium wanjuense]
MKLGYMATLRNPRNIYKKPDVYLSDRDILRSSVTAIFRTKKSREKFKTIAIQVFGGV